MFSKCVNHKKAKCTGLTNPGVLSMIRLLSSESRVRLSLRCWMHFLNLNSLILWLTWILSLAFTWFVIGLAVVIQIGIRFMPSLSLCFMSDLTTFPSRSSFQVPTFVGVINGSSNRAQEAAGSWSRWKPELSLSLGISFGLQMPTKLSTMSDFPALV